MAKAKTDSARKIVMDSVNVLKKQVVASAKEQLVKQLTGTKDSTGTTTPLNGGELKKKAEGTGKEIMKNLFGKKKKD
jgi:hypothetical protein